MILRLQNDLYCVGWGVKLYSLTHPTHYIYGSCSRHFVGCLAVWCSKLTMCQTPSERTNSPGASIPYLRDCK